MQYVYPKLSSIDLNCTRIGGLGLGNMMFPYARALLYARDHQAALIWPTWNSIPVGQILRREKDKRFYNDLFRCPKGIAADGTEGELIPVLSGIRKRYHRINRKKLIEFSGMEGEFTPILGSENSRFLYHHFCSILQERNRAALGFTPGDGICMHVRLGDFTRQADSTALKEGLPNLSIPVAWYVGMVQQIRAAVGRELPVYLFSDGTDEELSQLLQLPGVRRITFGTAIGDILAMVQARLFIASGSTFSRWVRYFGRMNTICYPGQQKQKLLDATEKAFEIEAETLPQEICTRLRAEFGEEA